MNSVEFPSTPDISIISGTEGVREIFYDIKYDASAELGNTIDAFVVFSEVDYGPGMEYNYLKSEYVSHTSPYVKIKITLPSKHQVLVLKGYVIVFNAGDSNLGSNLANFLRSV